MISTHSPERNTMMISLSGIIAFSFMAMFFRDVFMGGLAKEYANGALFYETVLMLMLIVSFKSFLDTGPRRCLEVTKSFHKL